MFRWTPDPVIVTIRENVDHFAIFLYSYYTTITWWGSSKRVVVGLLGTCCQFFQRLRGAAQKQRVSATHNYCKPKLYYVYVIPQATNGDKLGVHRALIRRHTKYYLLWLGRKHVNISYVDYIGVLFSCSLLLRTD